MAAPLWMPTATSSSNPQAYLSTQGGNTIHIYVGNETVSPQVGLDGVTRNNYNPALNEDNFIGGVGYFGMNPNGGVPPPTFSAKATKALPNSGAESRPQSAGAGGQK